MSRPSDRKPAAAGAAGGAIDRLDLRAILKKVRRIEITARRKVNEGMAGQYHSVFKGRGVEFLEVRDYQPGDDVRSIDWNVSARMGHPYVKLNVEERELTVLLAVDVSGSQAFGTGRQMKSELAAEVCALVAFSAIRNNDRVGLMLFSDQVERYIPPARGSAHGLWIIREMLAFRPASRRTGLAAALEAVGRLLRRRAVVFLVSDFRDRGFDRSLRIAARRHDLIALSVSDPREGDWPDCGLVEMEDAESGRRFLVDSSSPAVRALVARMEAERQSELKQMFRRAGVDHVPLRTDEPYEKPLLAFFHQRARRMSA